ncbi:MAG TPA: hypothetical protein DDX89_03250 [Candidatus Omnitrophica bacterium]|nr:MAG: hypothetical protein A2Z92_04280 [Omnitrophica WOR_2 bacterium GWA2_63_20]OGX15457.1 MAG: hypothetical protein A2105_02335 [Omnitrophica WOR_2 bacterium GWF2_63_9]OGX32849.1 MAG: hypothetical protein A3E56_02115 [Omnitrophica WOR_2 bacterium RIFCSPHIGHO2_12_FULL_64_13]OGX35336.1 MAG: hypothetical protein A3B73_02905 [Omnitrophica WOR_2 bacterium RIFCSPHIGHO2_02_FULL_63_39]OGX46321.1 MAG: hypothetical protein A3I71_07935 [Omnitrophica WOR_2 bacterium RIFCSPLOWO2_02_FULL_63_16]OGX47100.1
MRRLLLFVLGLWSVIPLTGFITLRWVSMGKEWVQPTVMFGILNTIGILVCLSMWSLWKAVKSRMPLSAGAWLVMIYLPLAIPLSVMVVMAEHRGLWSESAAMMQSFMSRWMMSMFVVVSPLTLLVLIGGAAIASQTVLLVTNVAANALYYFLLGTGFERWVIRRGTSHG